ncbi:MAG: PD40 domain-containing protein [Actinobacteria bacterium]|nr:PD40 domain-containing protein [Actinomycetota bacterium]
MAFGATDAGGGKLAFASDRDGDNELYSMKADGSLQTRLTDNVVNDSRPAWSPDGRRLAYDSSPGIWVLYAKDGRTRMLTGGNDSDPTWSPDGSKVAFARCCPGGWAEIFVVNSDGSGAVRLTHNVSVDGAPAWSPDGTRIAFLSLRDGDAEIFLMNPDGTDQTQLTFNDVVDGAPAWSPDGSQIAFCRHWDRGDFEIFRMNADGAEETNLTNDPAGHEYHPTWSPDGAKIAFESTRDGNSEIYVMEADGSAQTNISNNAATETFPSWRPAG